MHIHGVLATYFYRHLANSFEEWQGFDITDGTADFNQNHIVTFATFKDAFFDCISDMRNNLNGRAQIVTTTLFTQHIRVDATSGKVIAAGHFGTDETFVMT